MPSLVIILHSKEDLTLAEQLKVAISAWGYEAWHRGMTSVGDIELRELTDRMARNGPIVICGTQRAAGSMWLSKLIAHVQGPNSLGRPRLFPVRMELDANLEALGLSVTVAECCHNFQEGITQLKIGLCKHYPLPGATDAHPNTTPGTDTPNGEFDAWLTNVGRFSTDTLKEYRKRLSPKMRDSVLTDDLDAPSFLSKANLARDGNLFAAGVLLLTEHPEQVIPSAYVQCVQYSGVDKSSAQDGHEYRGPLIAQIEGAMTFVKSRVENVEIREPGAVAAKFEYAYPMVCLSEILANALCHRDYLDRTRHTHVRLFQDRIEIVSPGTWEAKQIPEAQSVQLADLRCEPASKNERLATALRWIRLVETQGSGIPNALKDCIEQEANNPIVISEAGMIKVTVFPRRNWDKSAVNRRGLRGNLHVIEHEEARALELRREQLDELVLELTDLKLYEQDGRSCPSARARLLYQPATLQQREVASVQSWRFIAPISPIEAGELRWYLEQYAIWPSHYFRDRARKVEENLVKWGRLLYETAIPVAYRENIMQAWVKNDDLAARRFSVYVDTTFEAGASDVEIKSVHEVASLILGLPWELLHNGDNFLFQGAKPTRVRRRLPNTKVLNLPVVSTPIRILLITSRPEDDSCGYIDHRVSALPLVEAMEALPGLVKIHVLSPATLPALRAELERAREAKQPYHVVHFDGHGVYDKQIGLGGLCFEAPEDTGKLEKRRHVTIHTSELGPLLRDHCIPLVFLETMQTAQAEQASESVASELLKVGVASVVAMSHSVLVETARRFVEMFYQTLAEGKRVGDAMLEGQRRLKDDTFRGRIFGVGELRLEDWFVPVLFQEKDDPQLFNATPTKETVEDFKAVLATRLGHLPPVPESGFVGRSRELLALQRLLRHERYAVVRGQGGEGKTALVAEFARWMVRSHQLGRAAFVSVEAHNHRLAVLDAIGNQLIGNHYSAAAFDDMEQAILPIERALREQSTLLVVDNMEAILLHPYLATPEALSEEAERELKAILSLYERLMKVGETRLVFTSREPLPVPFDVERHRRELHQLDREDAIKLVERVLNATDGEGGSVSDAAREQIEQLVEAVHCHAMTLTLLAPSLRARGVEATRDALVDLMATMERQFPGNREQSLFASVELSLRRMSEENRHRARVLGVFHGGVYLDVLRHMMQWEELDVGTLAGELIETGLATPNRYNHLTLNPALCPYLRGQLDTREREALTARWIEAMHAYAGFLVQQRSQNTEVAATLTMLELQNLFALLGLVQRAGDAETTIDLATSLYSLLEFLGKPRLLERVGQVRDAAAKDLEKTKGDVWNHARFQTVQTRIEQQRVGGRLREALESAQQLLKRARAAGKQAYPNADYDLAEACFLLARVLRTAGSAEQALPLLEEAWLRFESVPTERVSKAAERMASICIAEQGDCLRDLGRLDEAEATYKGAIRRSEQLDDVRQVAMGKGQLGIVRMLQRRYPEALTAYTEARERFTQLDEPGSVAATWYQTGIVYQCMGQPEAAEDAYRKSLAIEVRLGNIDGQANTLNQLGIVYDDLLGRTEEAVAFFRQAIDKSVESHDMAKEGGRRSNLALRLHKLSRLDEARQEIRRAIECKEQFGYAAQPWTSWAILANIETDADNVASAAEAKGKAIACYLAYRRDGGENHDASGRLFHAVTEALQAEQRGEAEQLIRKYREQWKNDKNPEADALQAIVDGSRDRTLADSPDLDYSIASEILFLIETLENHR